MQTAWLVGTNLTNTLGCVTKLGIQHLYQDIMGMTGNDIVTIENRLKG